MNVQMNKSTVSQIHDDSERVGLWLQPGFVEGVQEDKQTFDSLYAALHHIFQHNLESAILLWNAVPVSMDYTDDIPVIIVPLVCLLNEIQENEQVSDYDFKIFSKHLSFNWYIDATEDQISICAEWHRVPGDSQDALNFFSTMTYDRKQFLGEWKLLLEQCIQAIKNAGAKFHGQEAKKAFKQLCEVESKIPMRGRFYQYT